MLSGQEAVASMSVDHWVPPPWQAEILSILNKPQPVSAPLIISPRGDQGTVLLSLSVVTTARRRF